jgi:hypothetical protein
VKQDLESTANSEIEKEKRGTLAFTDNTKLTQEFSFDDKTIRNIQSTIDQKLQTYVEQSTDFGQTMLRGVVVVAFALCRVGAFKT